MVIVWSLKHSPSSCHRQLLVLCQELLAIWLEHRYYLQNQQQWWLAVEVWKNYAAQAEKKLYFYDFAFSIVVTLAQLQLSDGIISI